MKKIVYLLILLILGAVIVYIAGPGLMGPTKDIIRRGQTAAQGKDLNDKGVAALDAGNPAEALVHLREARLLYPDDPVIARNLSIALARTGSEMTGDSEEAVRLLKESLQVWPRNPEGLDGLSITYYRAGRYRQALDYALVLQQMMPDRSDLADYVRILQMKVADEQGMSSERGDSFRLLYSDEKRLEYRGEILTILQNQLDSLTTSLGIFPDRTIDVLILTDDLGTRATPMDPLLEGLYDGQIRLYVGEDIQDRQEFVRIVRHEMVHALLHQAAGYLPGWVQEGLAQKAGEEPGEKRLTEIRRYVASQIRGGNGIDLSSAGGSFVDLDDRTRSMAYSASLLFMDYLYRKYGDAFIPRFVAELSSGVSPEDALKKLTGKTFEDLQASLSGELERTF